MFKIRKIITFLLVFITSFTLSACGDNDIFEFSKTPFNTSTAQNQNAFETPKEDIKNSSSNNENNNSGYSPKLYKVTDKNGNIAWLFGSIHVGESDFFPLPDYVTSALYGADVVAVEFDVIAFESDYEAQASSLTKMISPYQSIKSHLTGANANDTYNKAVQILTENNIYNIALDYYKPVVWSMLIDNITYEKYGADATQGIDRHIIQTAKEKNIKVEDIESADAQYQMLANFSDPIQTKMLADSITNYNDPNSKRGLQELMDVWAKGDYTKLRKMLKQEDEAMFKQIPDYFNEYNNAMKTQRDALMTKYVIDALADKKEAFVCVGAAHIAQENGIVDSLKAKGYIVEEVK